MRIHPTVSDVLSLFSYVLKEGVVGESAVVAMIMLYTHTVRLCEFFKGVLGLDGVLRRESRLEMDIAQTTIVINKDGGCLLSSSCRNTFKLGKQAR